jgi:hypothetical protein
MVFNGITSVLLAEIFQGDWTAKGETEDLLKKEVIFDYFTLFVMRLYASSYGATTTSISCLTHYVRVTTKVVI